MLIRTYSNVYREEWDCAVRETRQSSFLFERDFMDYHKDRFEDISLMIYNDHHRILALLPASISRSVCTRVESHGGLTYGGLLLMPSVTASSVGEILQTCLTYYKNKGYTELIYKPLPHIYHVYPAEEDIYWLFRIGASLEARTISSVIDLKKPYSLSTLRKRKVHKAERYGSLRLNEDSDKMPDFWNMLQNVLRSRHDTEPVHSLDELNMLVKRFPESIRLFTVYGSDESTRGEDQCCEQSEILAGCVLFITSNVVHVQYIAASDKGCDACALDWLFNALIQKYQSPLISQNYFDFGISTEDQGRFLNEGLIFQKEGFGARAVCYDTYKIVL